MFIQTLHKSPQKNKDKKKKKKTVFSKSIKTCNSLSSKVFFWVYLDSRMSRLGFSIKLIAAKLLSLNFSYYGFIFFFYSCNT